MLVAAHWGLGEFAMMKMNPIAAYLSEYHDRWGECRAL